MSEPLEFLNKCAQIEKYLLEGGFGFGPRLKIAYGVKWELSDSQAKLNLCLYYGKKGISFSLQGKESSFKNELLEELNLIFFKQEINKDSLPTFSTTDSCGSDETGKGDWFGPLVCACVYTNSARDLELLKIGVKDSKALKDKEILALAQKIKDLDKQAYDVLVLRPHKYNELYQKFTDQKKNLNHLLAWMHATTIKNLRIKKPVIKKAYVDQFTKDEKVAYLLKDLKSLEVEQKTGGESNLAVAAASIIARAELIYWHNLEEKNLGVKIPYGAGSKTYALAKDILKKQGEEGLFNYVKWHFKSTKEVISC